MSNDLIICAVVAAVFNRGIKYRILIQPPCNWYGLKSLFFCGGFVGGFSGFSCLVLLDFVVFEFVHTGCDELVVP